MKNSDYIKLELIEQIDKETNDFEAAFISEIKCGKLKNIRNCQKLIDDFKFITLKNIQAGLNEYHSEYTWELEDEREKMK